MKPLAEDAWNSWRSEELAQRLHGSGITWYVTGGWALDLFLGQQPRDHADLEFATLPSDIPKARGALSELEFFAARNGGLSFLERDADVPDDIWQLWGADFKSQVWRVDMMIERGTKDRWFYKRNNAISQPRDQAIYQNDQGILFLAPANVLLFKAKYTRDKDVEDFDRVLPHLRAHEKALLRRWIVSEHTSHPWLAQL
jgi:hypothetical protein